MSDYMMTITFAPTYEEADADGLMEVLLNCSGDLAPVVDIDAAGVLSATVGFEAQNDFETMIAAHIGAFGAAMAAAGVDAHDLVDVHLSAREPELQPE